MLKIVRDLPRYSQQIIANGLLKDILPCMIFHNRSLYAATTLGIDGFKGTQDKIQSQFANMTERFRSKMKEFSNESSSNMIFTEDLKNMIHLAQNTPEDMALVRNMLVKFIQQNKELRFGNYVFGPVLMRMFYCMGNVEVPLELFKNPEFEEFFQQVISHQILMDMLYEKGSYQEILDLYSKCTKENLRGQRHLVVLVMASCYKLNTADSLKYAVDLWNELTRAGKIPMRKATTFAAGLALMQNDPGMALEMVSTVRQHTYMTVRNIKALAMARLGRFEDVLVNLKAIIEVERTGEMKQSISKGVIEEVLALVRKNDSKELLNDIERMCKYLETNGHLTEKNLDDLLTTEITVTGINAIRPEKSNRSILAGSFRAAPSRTPVNPRFVRPGLAELN